MPDRRTKQTRYYRLRNGEVRRHDTPPHPLIGITDPQYELPRVERVPLDLDHTYAHRMERAERASAPGGD